MAFGFVVHDLLYLTLVGLLYGGGFAAGRAAFAALSSGLPWFVAAPIALCAALLTAIALAGLLTAACPRLTPGRYPMMRGRVFFSWMLRALIRRALFLPATRWIIFSSNVLRFCALRALGARVAFTASFSADVDLLDPALTIVEAGAIVGARCLLAGHFVQGGELLLGEVRVERGALLAGEVIAMPGVRIGPQAIIKGRASLSVGADIGARASIGACTMLDAHARIGDGAHVGNACLIGPRVEVAAGAEVQSGAKLYAAPSA